MADIVKFFYEYGRFYSKDLEKSFNQIYEKKIDNVAVIDIPSYKLDIYDLPVVASRLFLCVISPNSGNLFPFIFMADKVFDREEKGKNIHGGLTKSIENLGKYINDEDKDGFCEIKKLINFERIKKLIDGIQKERKKQYYLALSYNGKFFNELYGYVVSKFRNSKKAFKSVEGVCFIENKKEVIGFDAELNFCSVNELPASIGKTVKPRLLSLSVDAGELVRLGFNRAFIECKFSLMGKQYILMTTIFGEDRLKEEVLNFIRGSKKIDRGSNSLMERKLLEEDLDAILKESYCKKYEESILFSFLFYNRNNREIVLYQTIEDVAPSRIKNAMECLNNFDIDISNLSKYHKKSFHSEHPEIIYLRDYIQDRLIIAKLLFGKEKLTDDFILSSIAAKLLTGNNQKNRQKQERREFSKLISGYYKDDTDFSKHQKVINFLHSIGVCKNIFLGGEKMNFNNLTELIDWKFKNVDLMKDSVIAKEFYVIGMLAQFIIRFQKKMNADNNFKSSLESYIDTAGLINMSNRHRIFNKIINGAKKYNVYGDKWNYLLSKYSDIKSTEQLKDRITIDIANILFVMGSIDYKNLKNKGE